MPITVRKLWTVALLGWQDSLVYRFNAFIWVLYAIVPSLTVMLVWLAAYQSAPGTSVAPGTAVKIGGMDLSRMITYYLTVTALSIAITPNPEWQMATQIRDGLITAFIVKPIGYFGYKAAEETSYQIIKTAMMLPAFTLMVWGFRDYIRLPQMTAGRIGLFLLAAVLAYGLLMQLKFMLGLAAFWLAETAGLIEIWTALSGLFAGRLLPLALLPAWVLAAGHFMPFASTYAFPIQLLLESPESRDVIRGFLAQLAWLALFSLGVRMMWRRGLVAYEAFGG